MNHRDGGGGSFCPITKMDQHLRPRGSSVYSRFKEIGFRYVTLDMHGYSQGSMNATIGK